MLSLHEERGYKQYIGIDPKLAETIVDNCLKKKLLTKFKNTHKYCIASNVWNYYRNTSFPSY